MTLCTIEPTEATSPSFGIGRFRSIIVVEGFLITLERTQDISPRLIDDPMRLESQSLVQIRKRQIILSQTMMRLIPVKIPAGTIRTRKNPFFCKLEISFWIGAQKEHFPLQIIFIIS